MLDMVEWSASIEDCAQGVRGVGAVKSIVARYRGYSTDQQGEDLRVNCEKEKGLNVVCVCVCVPNVIFRYTFMEGSFSSLREGREKGGRGDR